MAPKSDKEPKASKGSTPLKKAGAAKAMGKSKKPLEDDDDILDDESENVPAVKKSMKSSPLNKAEEDDEDSITPDEEVADEWKKVEDDDEEWDPDFDEFDVPKSKSGKKITGTKKGADEEEDFKIDEEFKDMLGGKGSKGYDDDDDDY